MSQQVDNPAGPHPPQDFIPSRPRASLLPLICCCLIILTVYVWLISVGTWTRWPTHWYAYDSLATSFLHGQLSLETRPDPALLALSNPYDPAARQGIPYPQDASLYNGRFYFYFGPFPALFLVIAKSFIPGQIGDQVPCLCICFRHLPPAIITHRSDPESFLPGYPALDTSSVDRRRRIDEPIGLGRKHAFGL